MHRRVVSIGGYLPIQSCDAGHAIHGVIGIAYRASIINCSFNK